MEYEVFLLPLLWNLPWHFLHAQIDVRLVVKRVHLSLAEKIVKCQRPVHSFTRTRNSKLQTGIYLACG